jgi:hypothetical protein
MKDIDDWEFILDTVDALFYGLSNGIAKPHKHELGGFTRAGMGLIRTGMLPAAVR